MYRDRPHRKQRLLDIMEILSDVRCIKGVRKYICNNNVAIKSLVLAHVVAFNALEGIARGTATAHRIQRLWDKNHRTVKCKKNIYIIHIYRHHFIYSMRDFFSNL